MSSVSSTNGRRTFNVGSHGTQLITVRAGRRQEINFCVNGRGYRSNQEWAISTLRRRRDEECRLGGKVRILDREHAQNVVQRRGNRRTGFQEAPDQFSGWTTFRSHGIGARVCRAVVLVAADLVSAIAQMLQDPRRAKAGNEQQRPGRENHEEGASHEAHLRWHGFHTQQQLSWFRGCFLRGKRPPLGSPRGTLRAALDRADRNADHGTPDDLAREGYRSRRGEPLGRAGRSH